MALTPHKDYERYKKEHLDAGNSEAHLVSEEQWNAGSPAGEAGGEEGATSEPGKRQQRDEAASVGYLTREDKKFNVSGHMQEIGQTEAGLERVDAGLLASLDVGSDVVLYDDATGKLYRTKKWKDVQKNWDSLVSSTGVRQRVAHVVSRSEGKGDKEKVYQRAYEAGRDSPFGVDVIYGLNEEIPEAGTEEFRAWISDKFSEGVQQQAAAHRYDPKTGSTGTGYGQFGSISYADWVELGRPRTVGSDTIQMSDEDFEALSKYSDDQLRNVTGQYLTTVDKKTRAHGLQKTLNNVGGAFGYDRLGTETMRALKYMKQLDVGGSKLLYNTQTAYAGSRNSGKDTSGAVYDAGKAVAYTVAEQTVEGIRDVLILLAAYTAWTGVGGAVFGAGAAGAASLGATLGAAAAAGAAGAAAGAAAGYASAYATSGVQSTIYGGYTKEYRKAQKKGAEKASAAGAVSGTVTGLSMGLGSVGAGQGAWAGFASNPIPTAANAALRLGSGYVTNRYIYGASAHDANESLLISAAATAVGAYEGRNTPATQAAPSPLGSTFAEQSFANGNYFAAFRETMAAQNNTLVGAVGSPVNYSLGSGTSTRAFMNYASTHDLNEGGKQPSAAIQLSTRSPEELWGTMTSGLPAKQGTGLLGWIDPHDAE